MTTGGGCADMPPWPSASEPGITWKKAVNLVMEAMAFVVNQGLVNLIMEAFVF